MSLPHLPIEIWCKILDEGISLPSFLDPSHLPQVTDPLYRTLISDRDYWEIERHRNILRRVCKSWNTYLRAFDHRYVRLDDVHHLVVSKDALRKARHIGYQSCWRGSSCKFCRPPELPAHGLLVDLLASLGKIPVEIIHGGYPETEVLHELVKHSSKYLPRLQVIFPVEHRPRTDTDWIESLSLLPNLRYLRLTSSGSPNWPAFHTSSLTNLSFSCLRQPFSLSLYDCKLPSLKHLRFPTLPTRHSHLEPQIPALLRILEGVGHNLLSLQVGVHGLDGITIPADVWKLCPRLERLDSGLKFSYDSEDLPPADNVLHTISFSMDHFMRGFESIAFLPRNPPLHPTSLPRFPKLERLIMGYRWSRLSVEGIKKVKPWIPDLAEACRNCGVIFEDIEGIRFEDCEVIRTFEDITQ